MPRTLRARIISATAALLLAGVVGVVASGGVASAEVNPAVQAALATSPVGTWTGTVQHGTTAGALTITLRAAGLVCLASGDSGGAGGNGLGVWWGTGATQFRYRVLERLHDAAGATTGYVDVNQNATISGNTFTSSGTSRIYDQHGTFIATATATVNVTRSPTTASVC